MEVLPTPITCPMLRYAAMMQMRESIGLFERMLEGGDGVDEGCLIFGHIDIRIHA